MPISSGSIFFINISKLESVIKSANLGDKTSIIKLYNYYTFSMENELKSVYWLTKAAELGHPASQYNLAHSYLEKNDLENAIKWANLALKSGNQDAKEFIAEIEDIIKNRK